MGQFGMGQSVRRVEDQRFITGHGRYTDDINLPHQAYAYVLRSPHAHARITRIDASAAAHGAGRDRRADRQGSGGRRHRPDPLHRAHHQQRRLAAGNARPIRRW